MKRSTTEHLAQLAAREALAMFLYEEFARKASTEGEAALAAFFGAAGISKAMSARGLVRAMKVAGASRENLSGWTRQEIQTGRAAWDDASGTALAEGHKIAARLFDFAKKVEGGVLELAEELLKNASRPIPSYFVCKACGHVAEHEAPETCPVCGVKKSAFVLVGPGPAVSA